MKIKVIERGETEFDAGNWTEPELRAALAGDDKDGSVRSAIYYTTGLERDTSTDEYITITEDDGTPLWEGWLSGHLKDKPAPGAADATAGSAPASSLDAASHAQRYLRAAYGPDYVFAAPETFANMLERWIWAVGAGEAGMAETCMAAIGQHFAERARP